MIVGSSSPTPMYALNDEQITAKQPVHGMYFAGQTNPLFPVKGSCCFTRHQDIEDLLSQMPFHWPKGVLIRQVGELDWELDGDFATLGHRVIT